MKIHNIMNPGPEKCPKRKREGYFITEFGIATISFRKVHSKNHCMIFFR